MDEMQETYLTKTDADILNQAKAHGVKTTEDFEDLAGPSFFISIPSALLMRADLSPEAKIIYAMIIGLTRVKGRCNPTNEYLSKISNIPARSIRRALVLLYKAKLVSLDLKKDESGTWRYLSPITTEMYAQFPGLTMGGPAKLASGGRTNRPPRSAKLATQNNKEDNNKETTTTETSVSGSESPSVSLNGNSHNSQKTTAPLEAALPYVLKDDLARVVCAWKITTGHKKEDRSWDRAHWKRTAKTAKELLAYLGTWQNAADCIQDVYEEMQAKRLSCTIETIMKHSGEWKLKNVEVAA